MINRKSIVAVIVPATNTVGLIKRRPKSDKKKPMIIARLPKMPLYTFIMYQTAFTSDTGQPYLEYTET